MTFDDCHTALEALCNASPWGGQAAAIRLAGGRHGSGALMAALARRGWAQKEGVTEGFWVATDAGHVEHAAAVERMRAESGTIIVPRWALEEVMRYGRLTPDAATAFLAALKADAREELETWR